MSLLIKKNFMKKTLSVRMFILQLPVFSFANKSLTISFLPLLTAVNSAELLNKTKQK